MTESRNINTIAWEIRKAKATATDEDCHVMEISWEECYHEGTAIFQNERLAEMDISELKALKASVEGVLANINAEIEGREDNEQEFIYREGTSAYNSRRYGKPWVAKVDFSAGGKGEFEFGDWTGYAGEEGELEIKCKVGDILAFGQKDSRKPANSRPDFYLVKGTGGVDDIESFSSKSAAYKYYRDNK